MKKNIYYSAVYGRMEMNKKVIGLIISSLGLPKTVLDVFLRKNMGERYYSLFGAVLVGLGVYGAIYYQAMLNFRSPSIFSYIFLAVYVIMAVLRYLEIRREPSVFDFAKFSLSSGVSHPFFKRIRLFGLTPTQRRIDVYYEPLLCLLVGLLILIIDPMVGVVIVFCSICYYLHNMLAARMGDHFVMDKIDEIICNQELSETFVQNKEVSPRQVPFYGRKPSSEQLRKAFADDVLDADNVYEDEALAV